MESLSSLDPRLGPLLCQPLAWYQSLDRVLTNKYGPEVIRRYCSLDQSVQHTLVLSPNYLEAFVMLSVDLHSSRGVSHFFYSFFLAQVELLKCFAGVVGGVPKGVAERRDAAPPALQLSPAAESG